MTVKGHRVNWIYEEILAKLPPFAFLSKRAAVLLQLAIMEVVGFLVATYFELPAHSIAFGTLVIVAVGLSSSLVIKVADATRNLVLLCPSDRRGLHQTYFERMFNKLHLELGLSIFLFAASLIYLLSSRKLLVHWFGENSTTFVLLPMSILLWDVCYRMSLVFWSTYSTFMCSFQLAAFCSRGGVRTYRDVPIVEKIGITNLYLALSFSLLLPLCVPDPPMLLLLVVYIGATAILSELTHFVLRKIHLYSTEVTWLLNEGSFGYAGTVNKAGQPHVTPVIYVFDGKSIYFVTSKISKKISNLRNNPQIAFLVDMRDPISLLNNRAVLISGRAKVFGVLDAALDFLKLLEIRRLFYAKYPNYMKKYEVEQESLPSAWRSTIFVSRLVIRVDPVNLVYWKGAKLIPLL